MRSLASFVMSGRMQAVLVTVLCAGLSVILPPFIFLSGGAVALVTMRQGGQHGLSVVAISALVLSLITAIGTGTPLMGLMLLVVWLPVWLLSIWLRQTVSFSLTMAATAVLGLVSTLLAFMVMGDPVAVWQQFLDELLTQNMTQAGVEITPEVQNAIEQSAKVMTGVMASALMLNVLFSVMMGRWWQALLYNPGGFRQEFYSLRMPKSIAVLTVVVMVVSLIAEGGMAVLAGNLMIVLVVFFLFQGLAICHAIVTGKGMHTGWLVGLYVMMFIVGVQMAMVLITVGFVDVWMDIRSKMKLEAPKTVQDTDQQDGSN